MTASPYVHINAIHQFENTRRRAQLGRWWRRLRRQPQTLLSFADIRGHLPRTAPRNRGLREIPLHMIAGSVDRADEFDRNFRPLSDALRHRWVQVRELQEMVGWEPIDVYQVGDLYFVQDGHHRVSVARQLGLHSIEAHVREFPLRAALAPTDSLAQIIAKVRDARRAAYAPHRPYGCATACLLG